MNNLVKDINFETLKENFDTICDEVNNNGESVALTLKNNRKVFIIPEENYNNISCFISFQNPFATSRQ